MDGTDRHYLKPNLLPWQIFFIVASAVIGEGIFSGNAFALEASGPSGAILALFIVVIVLVCVLECLSELVQLFPAPNAIPEYIAAFVDEDFAWICGFAYWFAFASIIANLNLTASACTDYWEFKPIGKVIVFYIVVPVLLWLCNMFGVYVFGWIESVGGALKILLVLSTGIYCYVLGHEGVGQQPGQRNPILDGFQTKAAPNPAIGVIISIPSLIYSLIGTESIAVTAFEARSSRSLAFPSRYIAYALSFLYLFTYISELTVTKWSDLPLAPPHPDNLRPRSGLFEAEAAVQSPQNSPNTSNMVVVAALNAGHPKVASFFNAAIMFSVLSASNTAAYIASRTLYGLTLNLRPNSLAERIFGRFSTVVPRTGVPAMSLLFCFVSFAWVPFLSLKPGIKISDIQDSMETPASIAVLLIWAALCLAFIRYTKWLEIWSKDLRDDPQFQEYIRNTPAYKPYTHFGFAQPWPAYIGLVGSLVIAIVFTTATWWQTTFKAHNFFVAWGSPLFILIWWVGLKFYTGRKWVQLDDQRLSELQDRIQRLRWNNRGEAGENQLDHSSDSERASESHDRPVNNTQPYEASRGHHRNQQSGSNHPRQSADGQTDYGHRRNQHSGSTQQRPSAEARSRNGERAGANPPGDGGILLSQMGGAGDRRD